MPRKQEPHLYRDRLPTPAAESFDRATPDLDVAEEIKLLRATLAELSHDPAANARDLTHVTNQLSRLVALQARLQGDTSSIEQAIADAAALILDHHHLEDTLGHS